MPVIRCQKDNKDGFKWGRQGVCFTESKDGLSPHEQAARVGRAIAAKRLAASDDTLGGFLIPIDHDNHFVPALLIAYENHLKNNDFELSDEVVDVSLVAEHGKIKLWRLADGYGEWYFIYRDQKFSWLAQKMPDVRAFDTNKELSGILNKETIQNIGWGDGAWDKFLATWMAGSVSKGESDMLIEQEVIKQEEALIAKLVALAKQTEGIQFVIGRLKGETTTTVQSVLFDKEKWTAARARTWLKDHDFKSVDLDETEERLRFRQRDPGDFQTGSFRTIDAGERRTAKNFPINEYGWTVQQTFHAIQDMSRKFSPEEAKLVTPAPDSSKTCGACRFYLRDPLGGPIGRCQVVEGEIPWFATSALYISAASEAAAALAVAGQIMGAGAYTDEREEEDMERIAKRGVILKTHDPGFVLSPILVPDEPDLEGDVISPEEIESAAHEYMASSQNVGVMHQRIVRSQDAQLVESYIARGDHKIAGHNIKKGTWMGGFRIVNEKIKQAIKDGKLTGVSIGGIGLRTPVED